MKSLILAAVLWANAGNQIITVYDTDQQASGMGQPIGGVTSIAFDEDSNAALLANLKANLNNATLSNGVIRISGVTQNVVSDQPGGSVDLFKAATNSLRQNFGLTITNMAQLKANRKAIFRAIYLTNNITPVTAANIAKANSAAYPILQLQIDNQ